jgi:hypothetical protein
MKYFRHALVVTGSLLITLIAIRAFEDYVLRATPQRCGALTAILGGLSKGMPRTEVEEVLKRESAPFIRRNDQGDVVTLWVYVGRLRACKLSLSFEGSHLIHARMGSEGWRAAPMPVPPGF